MSATNRPAPQADRHSPCDNAPVHRGPGRVPLEADLRVALRTSGDSVVSETVVGVGTCARNLRGVVPDASRAEPVSSLGPHPHGRNANDAAGFASCCGPSSCSSWHDTDRPSPASFGSRASGLVRSLGGVGQTSQLDAGAAARLPFVRAVGFLGTVMVQIISRIPPTSSDSLMTIPPPVIGIQNEAQHLEGDFWPRPS